MTINQEKYAIKLRCFAQQKEKKTKQNQKTVFSDINSTWKEAKVGNHLLMKLLITWAVYISIAPKYVINV